MWLGWLLAHLIPLVWIHRHGTATGDLTYYYSGVSGHVRSAMAEYPEVGTWPARLVNIFASNSEGAFTAWFIAIGVLSSAFFTFWLLRSDPSNTHRAPWFWVLFVGVSGPIVFTRLDLYPALTVGAFAALQFSRSRIARHMAMVMLALATMMKLWPGVLGAGLVGGARRWSTWTRIIWFLGSLAIVCALIAAVAGPDRLLSPLNYQTDRGLQIESLAATPVMIFASFAGAGDSRWNISFAASKSFEITGPGVSTMIFLATVATVMMVIFAMIWAVIRLIKDDWSPMKSLAFSLTMVALIIASNKVFSPQYITWLAPLVAVALIVSRRRIVELLAVEVLTTALLTTFVYPVYYDWLLTTPPDAITVVILTLRNLGILLIAGTALWWAMKENQGPSANAD